MNGENIMDAIGELPEDLLAPVAELRKKRNVHWIRWASLSAACLLLVLIPLYWLGGSGETADLLRNPDKEIPMEEMEYGGQFNGQSQETAQCCSFRATVLEVDDQCVLVRPLEGEQELLSADKIYISFQKLENAPKMEVGAKVEIFYDGMIMESYPAQITGVTDIRVIE